MLGEDVNVLLVHPFSSCIQKISVLTTQEKREQLTLHVRAQISVFEKVRLGVGGGLIEHIITIFLHDDIISIHRHQVSIF